MATWAEQSPASEPPDRSAPPASSFAEMLSELVPHPYLPRGQLGTQTAYREPAFAQTRRRASRIS